MVVFFFFRFRLIIKVLRLISDTAYVTTVTSSDSASRKIAVRPRDCVDIFSMTSQCYIIF